MPLEIGNGAGGPQAPWVAGAPLTVGTQPEPGEIGISPSAVPVEVADPEVYRVPRTDETENPVPEPSTRVAEAPRLHAVEGRDKWSTTPLTTFLTEQRVLNEQIANPVTSVTVTPETSSGAAASTVQLAAAVAPALAPSEVIWSTSNPALATVDANGLVTRVATGEATITATSMGDPSKTDSAVITIT